MRCAIYARRSTEEHQHASIATQTELAQNFAASKGWAVVQTFVDDGVSGSEFTERHGLNALLASRGFDVVIVRDLDRIGRDMLRVPLLVEKLHERGVSVWCYSTGARVEIDDPMAKFLATALAFGRELEVRATRARVTERHRLLASKGFVTGGVVYGYRNVRTAEGVRHEIDDDQAAVVRELFARRAAGETERSLVLDLNRRGVASPTAGRRGTGSWSPSAVHEILHRARYVGVATWGQRSSTYRGGTRVETERPEVDRVRADCPAIVDRETWERVRAHDSERRGDAPVRRAPGRHLAIGHVVCDVCGGPWATLATRSGKGASVPAYGCAWHRDRGSEVCPVSLRRPAAEVDAAIIATLAAHLEERVVVAALDELHALYEADAVAAGGASSEAQRITQEILATERERDRLARAVAMADDVAALVTELRARERRIAALRVEAAAVPSRASALASWSGVRERALAHTRELSTLLHRDTAGAREVLSVVRGAGRWRAREILAGNRRRWEILGAVLMPPGGLLASPEGSEHSSALAAPEILVQFTCRSAA